MNSSSMSEFVSTQKACEILGVSKTIVKRLADNGDLETWKTPGGHRRIKLDSIQKALVSQQGKTQDNSTKKAPTSLQREQTIHVMVMDDDPVIQELFNGFRKSFATPMQLTQALNGYEGLVKAGEQAFSLIFVDINMPYMDGYEAIQALRRLKNFNKVTIIAITANPIESIERNRLPDDVILLEKPLNPDVIKKFMEYEFQLKNQVSRS